MKKRQKIFIFVTYDGESLTKEQKDIVKDNTNRLMKKTLSCFKLNPESIKSIFEFWKVD